MKTLNIIFVSIVLLIVGMNTSYAQVAIRADFGVVGYTTTSFDPLQVSIAPGLLYYGKFGIPSLFSKNTAASHHSNNPVEQDANIRTLKYYHKNGLDSLWDESENRINGYYQSDGYNNPNNQAALKNLIKLNWYDFIDPIIVCGIVNTCVLNSKY